MIKRLITSIITGSPETINAMRNNDIEAYYLPQGVITTHYRNKTHASPGIISKIGLNTNVILVIQEVKSIHVQQRI